MKRIEYFCRSIRHGDPIEEQMEEAKRGGIIKSYTLTTLSAMNARRNADICLWCDEIWSADHLHSCLCVPDHNCMFTCGIDFEVFAFVKVSKEGLKHVVVNDSQDEALVHCAEKVFEEMCDTNLCISSKEAIISSAPQVFDELTQPVLGTNPGQIIEENQDNNALISNFDNSNEIQADDECTRGNGNEGTRSDGISSSLIQHSMDKVYESRGESDNNFVKDIQHDAHNMDARYMLDELPIRTSFIKEMVQAASIIGESTPEPIADEIQVDDEDFEESVHPTHGVHVEQGVSLEYKHQMFSKLTALDGPYLCELVTLGADQERFSKLRGALHLANKLLLPNDCFDGNSTPKGSCFQVKNDSLMVLYSLPSMSLVKNVVLPLLLGDKDWFLGSSLSTIFESYVGRWTFLNFKELQSWGMHQVWWNCPLSKLNAKCVLEWCDIVIPSLKCMSSQAYINSFFKHNFDPGGKDLKVRLEGCDEVLIVFLHSECTLCHEEIVPQVKIFDPELIFRNVVGVLHVSSIFSVMSCKTEGIGTIPLRCRIKGGCTTLDIMIAHADIIHHTNVIFQMEAYDTRIMKKVAILSNVSNSICETFQWKLTACSLTLEDKGDFRGEEDKVYMEYTCQLFSILVFRHNHNSCRINKSVMFLISIFNPSGLSGPCELRDGHLNKFLPLNGLGLVLFADNMVIFVLNEQGSTTIWLFPFIFLSYSRIVIESLHSNLILALEGNVEYKRDTVYGVSSYNDAATICLDEYIKSVRFIFGSSDVLTHCHIRLVRDFLLWSIFFPYNKFKAGEIKKEFIWDPGIIAKIAYWTSNVLRVGLCKGGIFSKVRLMKLWAAGSMTSIVRVTGFGNFEYVSKSFKMSEVLREHWFITIRTMLVKKSAREGSRSNCKFSMFRSFVFSHVESRASKFVQTTEIIPFLACCRALSSLLESTDCAGREVTILVFDPGDYGNGQKVHRLKADQNGGNRFSDEDYQCYVFDPGGPLMLFSDAMVTNLRPGMCSALPYFKYHLSLILEDKDRFKGWVLIHIKNETKGSLVIYPSCFLFPKAYSLYKGIIKL